MSTAAIGGNRLARESSPYLRQHADNPVEWFPWGEDAFRRAREEDKPILLSIGYSSCHWCHVMAAESFGDPKIAALMNRLFVNIKVDREERPDVDEVYMNAVQMMTGSGGWPLTVFLTPDLKPFFGGTYFPPEPRRGMIGFPDLLERVAAFYRAQRGQAGETGAELAKALAAVGVVEAGEGGQGELDARFLDEARRQTLATLDAQEGGFGSAPKFPPTAALRFLVEESRRTGDPDSLRAATLTLDKMAAGGIRDHLGGGFHRYSVDRRWIVPHFEKMLYDNALLLELYARAWQFTGNAEYAAVARATADFLRNELQDKEGGFLSAIDADSEGEEGAFYVWTRAEILGILGSDAGRRFAAVYGATPEGNFEGGRNVLRLSRSVEDVAREEKTSASDLARELAESRRALLAARARRVRPGTDGKVITAWNGMAISALSAAGALLDEPRDLDAARRAADRILAHKERSGALPHSSIGGEARGPAFLDDYAWFARGLLDLYGATFERRYATAAQELARLMCKEFDGEGGLFYAPLSELPVRPVKFLDGATPSPNAVAWEVLERLRVIAGGEEFASAARKERAILAAVARRIPAGSYYALFLGSRALQPQVTVAVIGPAESSETRALLEVVRREASDGTIVLFARNDAEAAETTWPLFAGRRMLGGRPTAYVCMGRTCLPPATSARELGALLVRSRETKP